MKAPILPAHLTDLPRLGGGPVGAPLYLTGRGLRHLPQKIAPCRCHCNRLVGACKPPRTCHHSWTHAMQASGTKSQGSGGRGQRDALVPRVSVQWKNL